MMKFGKYQEILKIRGFRHLILYGFIARIPHAAIGVVLTLHITQTLGESFASAGIAAMIFMIGGAISGPWRGRTLDKKGLRYTLIPSIIIEAIVWPTIAFVNYYWMLPLIFIAGLFILPIYTIVRKSASVLVPQAQRKAAFSFDSISVEFIFMIAPALGIILCTRVSTSFTLIAFGLSSSLAGLGLWILNPPTESFESSPVVKQKLPLRQRLSWISAPLWGVFLASFSAGFVLVGTDMSIIAFLGQLGHVDEAWIVYLFWCSASVIGAIYYGVVKRDVSPILLPLAMAALIPLCVLGRTPLVLALLTIPTGLLCAASITSATEKTSELVEEDSRGEALGWQGSAMTVGSSVASPLIGLSIDNFGAWTGFTSSALVGVIVCLVALGLYGGRTKKLAL
ncbi:MAG: MFS transporter [Micrococcaceae bacterium]